MLFAIAERVRARLNGRDRAAWEREIEAMLESRSEGVGFRQALSRSRESFILEVKRTSPSSGGIVVSLDPAATARCYQNCGAAAISVLTEEDLFGGSLDDLAATRGVVTLPLLRKDFIIDKLQIAEAKAFGADAVLLIVALLSDELLREFIELASWLHIDALVEIHDELELKRAVTVGASIIGVNNRDLRTMEIDLNSGARLLQMVPDHCLRVAESGLKTRADVLMMRDSGANAFLIGSAVTRSADMPTKIRELMGL